MTDTSGIRSMRVFLVIWLGQFVSALGTGLGSFALGVWVYETTGSAALFAMMAFVAATTGLLLAPVAGIAVDRFDRRWLMILSDFGSATMTLLMAVLLYFDRLEPWHVYPIVFVMVGARAFGAPAFVASTSVLVPKRQLARANGLAEIAGTTSGVLAPVLAGVLVVIIGYHGVILVDFTTFLFAVGTLVVIRIPRPPETVEGRKKRSFWGNVVFGWRYIRERPGLFSLLILFAAVNFSLAGVQVLLAPLVLSFASPAAYGSVQSAAAAGALVGGVILSVWGGPRRRVWGIFVALTAQGLILFLGGLEPSVALIATAAALVMFTGPFMNGFSQSIWQSKVGFDVQGRVFAIRRLIARSTRPIAFLAVGTMADRIFEPLLASGGALADSVGRVIGTGPGRGVGLMFILLGFFLIVATAVSFFNPRLRRVEVELPDAKDETVEPESEEEPTGIEARLQGA